MVVRARRASVGIDGRWAIARSFMMLSFAAAALLVLTHQPRPPVAKTPGQAPPPSATPSPTDLPALPATNSPVSADLPNRPGGSLVVASEAIAPVALASPQPAATPAQVDNAPASPRPPVSTQAIAPPPASPSVRRAAPVAQRSSPARAMAALATGIFPSPTPFRRRSPQIQIQSATVAPKAQPSGFVAAQSAKQVLHTLPLHTPRLVVDLSDRQVHFYHGDQLKASYTVAIGQDGWETPEGTFRVIDRQTYPLWEHPITKELIGNDPRNPLGTRWISFWTDGVHSIGFHGTNRDDSVGQAVSHGCLRMLNADIEVLYDQVQMGTPVIVRP